MKVYNLFLCLLALALLMPSCNDSFMDRFPETNITEHVFFNSPHDLQTFSNNFYQWISSGTWWDQGTDNMITMDVTEIHRLMSGEITPDNVGQWGGRWPPIRNVNFMIARAYRTVGEPATINHYIGVARFFRAHLYYALVRRYSDVPWFSRDLSNTDIDLLFKPQDPRSLVVDSIMADLQFAVDHIRPGDSRTRLTRWTALAMQSRIALHEGTWRRYHPELGLTDSDRFFELAAYAARQIIDADVFRLHPHYYQLFNSLSLVGNREMIMFAAYDQALRRHNAHSAFDWVTGLSRDLMEDYLAIVDGRAVPFHTIPGYNTKTFVELFQDRSSRDSRMFQTFMNPGHIDVGRTLPAIPTLALGGFPQIKFRPTTFDQLAWGMGHTDLPVIRYAEVLLNYAEARAELGVLTQEDMDMTINLLRDRAGVPRATLAEWLTDIDPVQANRFPNVTSAQRGAILEIRRERRVELAAEGFRLNDLYRWRAGRLLERAPEGTFIRQLGLQDVTGDGVPDIAIVRTQADADAIREDETIPADVRARLTITILDSSATSFKLTGGDSGHIVQISQVDRWTFIEPKHYFFPIDRRDMLVNPNLVQNVFWR